MLKFGKHKGRTFADVLASDPGYCAWVLRENAPSTGLKGFRKYRTATCGGIPEVGKHKGRSYEQVLQDDPGYGDAEAFETLRRQNQVGFAVGVGGLAVLATGVVVTVTAAVQGPDVKAVLAPVGVVGPDGAVLGVAGRF